MAHVVSRVKVEDYERFIAVFGTRGKAKRAEHGSRGVTVYRSTDDPNEVINVLDWDREGVEAFMADPEVPAIMQEGGLQGPPEFTFVEEQTKLEA